jgi:multiple sugar transport system substrate-binding protein
LNGAVQGVFVASGVTQKGIYVHAGGQPSHCAAWDDPLADELCGRFFSGTRLTQSEAMVRPRYSGYVSVQTDGGKALQEYLRDGVSLATTLEKLNTLYRESRARGSKDFQTN